MARQFILTDGTQKILVTALRKGIPKRQAAALAGISKSALYDWIQKGENGDKRYVELSDAIKKAQAEFVEDALDKIKTMASKGNWTALAWILERVFQQDFGKIDKVALTDPTGEKEAGFDSLVNKLSDMSLAELKRLAKKK